MDADPFRGILPFVHVAGARSFRRAAQELGVTPAAVSKAIAQLEAEVGTRLLARTSRSVALTAEGEIFLARCRVALAEVEAGREALADAQRVARGTLTVTLSPILGRPLMRKLPAFTARYPGVRVDLRVTDRLTRLVDEKIDVALRLGPLPSSTLLARPLFVPRWVTVAAPVYLARHGEPTRPEDLEKHACLRFVVPGGAPRDWAFRRRPDGPEGDAHELSVPSALTVDQGDVLLEGAVAGLGIAQVLDFMVGDLVSQGRLIEVLAPYRSAGPKVTALHVPGRQGSPRVKAFVRFLLEAFGEKAP